MKSAFIDGYHDGSLLGTNAPQTVAVAFEHRRELSAEGASAYLNGVEDALSGDAWRYKLACSEQG